LEEQNLFNYMIIIPLYQ